MREADVVGVDGSDSAVGAVRWAARDAALHRVPLRLLAVRPDPLPASVPEADTNTWEDRLSAAARAAADAAPGIEVISEVRRGAPHGVLVDESERARRVVVGIRGAGERTGLPVGSTAEAVAVHARCPVVVVRGRPADPAAPVLVGVDGSRVGEPAVTAAFEEASVRGVALVAVHVWIDVGPEPWQAVDEDAERAEIDQAARAVLAERLAGWQERHPDVEVHRVVERDRPVRSLVRHAADAQLVVVGSRGRGGMTGLLLGSTSRALLHMAPCPVLIARTPQK
ncbi:universal stress protein [Saccharopolyspora subtropica]|uniref:Universal stress protein n=1 Tax=Saccharopolyspora thermophila TaxID=89367 RepID=A0A917K4X9_9PSEU|nr:universal stress protein [Saccharopolyspora subtropica]GGI99130.1 universal stress protein [Saccharopolyspora subtropica]